MLGTDDEIRPRKAYVKAIISSAYGLYLEDGCYAFQMDETLKKKIIL